MTASVPADDATLGAEPATTDLLVTGQPTGPSRVLGWIVAIVGCIIVAGWVREAPYLAEAIPTRSIPIAATVFYMVLFAPLIAVGGLFGLITRTRTFAPGQGLAAWLPGSFLAGLGGLLFAVALAWLSGSLKPESGGAGSAGLLATGIALTLVQVAGEEVVFRGWLQQLLGWLTGPWLGLVLASALFAAMHLLGGGMPLHALGNVFLAGLFFGLLAWRSGGIVASTAAHFGWNAAEDLGFGLSPNPGVGPFGAIHDVQIIGPAYWGGGEEGLNASIGTTVVLIALILPLLVLRQRSRGPA